ncbi:hypothetical protein BIU88_08255 [Chlorobaculum limnaeum]|uniref:Uncharacterized protein n=1 Tax=Chlorobaculum limnaeum TaxID=274537 RepID=A0A1D8D1W4_CHLLM|nr:hypothetical protein BIU88_08255 [Chlorobaculum limnaeum]
MTVFVMTTSFPVESLNSVLLAIAAHWLIKLLPAQVTSLIFMVENLHQMDLINLAMTFPLHIIFLTALPISWVQVRTL